MAKFRVETFKSSGKWYSEGEIELTKEQFWGITREKLIAINGGTCPGLSGNGSTMYILLTEAEPDSTDWGYPKLFPI